MSRPFSTRPGGRLDASFRDMTEADIKATLMPTQSCRSCRWWSEIADDEGVGCCEWPEPPLPDSITEWVMNTVRAGNRGQTCPTWEARDDHA